MWIILIRGLSRVVEQLSRLNSRIRELVKFERRVFTVLYFLRQIVNAVGFHRTQQRRE